MKKICIVLAGMFLVAAAATACGGSSSTEEAATTTPAATTSAAASPTTEASSPAAAGAATITIANNSFGDPITVPPGAQVSVTNNDSAEHSVTSDTAGTFDVEVHGGETATLTAPSQPGEYPYHCTYHPSMKGVLIVQ